LRIDVDHDRDPEQADQEADDAPRGDPLVGEQEEGKDRRQHGREAEDDRCDGARGELLTGKEERVAHPERRDSRDENAEDVPPGSGPPVLARERDIG